MPGSKDCLIIGADGFVGRGITGAARERGWDVKAVGRANYSAFVGREFDVVINANGNARRYLANQDPWFDFEASTASVYRTLFDFRCSQYVIISTVDVYNDPSRPEATREDVEIQPLSLCPYAFHKWLAERCVMRRGASWQVFRLAQLVGRGLKKGPLYDLLRGQPLWIHDDSRLHFMNTEKVGATIVELIENGPANEIFNVCGRGSVKFRRIRELLPAKQRSASRAVDRQCYDVSTEKTHALSPLPDSWEEVRAFVRESLGSDC